MKTSTGTVLRSRARLEPPLEEDSNLARELTAGFKRHANRTLLVDARTRSQWTGSQIFDCAGRLATGLIRRLNLRPSDVVLTICDHTGHEVLMSLGIVLAGGSLYGSASSEGYEEEKALCELVRPSVIVTNSRLHQMVLELKRNVPGLEDTRIVWIDNPTKRSAVGNTREEINGNSDKFDEKSEINNNDDNNNNNANSNYYLELMQRDQVTSFEELAEGPIEPELLEQVARNGIKANEHMATYMLTSGSTGRPKVVPSTHLELVYGLYSMISCTKHAVSLPDLSSNGIESHSDHQHETNGETQNKDRLLIPIDENCILAGDLPLDHGAGLNTMFLSFVIGSKFIVMPSYQADTFWQAVNDYRITTSIASTTFTYKLLSRLKELNTRALEEGSTLREHTGWDLSCFQFIACCGSKLAFIDLALESGRLLPHLKICQAYGATEIGFISLLSTADCRTHLNSVGHLAAGLMAKVVDRDSGKPLGPNERGELLVWAKSKFTGYKCHPDDNAQEIFRECHDQEGFYRTGDQAHYDHQERLYVHGRFKDTLFLMEDWKIMPAELEEVIDRHPLVAASAVVGVPDPDLPGCDAPRAFVLLKPPVETSANHATCNGHHEPRPTSVRLSESERKTIERDIYCFVAERTAEPKHLRGGVFVLDELPRVGLLNKVDRKVLRGMKINCTLNYGAGNQVNG